MYSSPSGWPLKPAALRPSYGPTAPARQPCRHTLHAAPLISPEVRRLNSAEEVLSYFRSLPKGHAADQALACLLRLGGLSKRQAVQDSKLDELLSALMKHMQKALRGPRALGAALVALARLRGSRAQELRSRCLVRAASERGAGPRDLANFAWAAATLSEQGAAVLQHVASEALAGRRSLKSGFEPLDLAQLCWSLGKLQEAPAPLSEALFAAAAERYAEFAPQGWANIAWACARLCPRGPKSALNCASKMIAAAAGALRSDPTAFAVQNMSNLAWAASTLAICDSPFFSSLATACRFAELGAQHVANIAWSFGTVAHQNDQFIQLLSQRSVDIGLATFQPEEFAGFLSALGMLSSAPPMLDAALQEVQRRVGPGQLGATELSGVIWALAALGQDSEAFAAAARAAEDRAAELSPQGVANVFWAFATLEVPWELGTSFPRLSGAAHACSPELMPQGLVNLAWALTVLMAAEAGSGSLEASTLQAVLSRASNLVGSLKTLELAALSWVAARCRADHAQAGNLEAPMATEVLQRLAGAEASMGRVQCAAGIKVEQLQHASPMRLLGSASIHCKQIMPVIAVALISGKKVVIEVEGNTRVNELIRDAQIELGVGLSKLINERGDVVNASMTLDEAGIENEETVWGIVRQDAIAASNSAFAVLRKDGSVITLGNPFDGGKAGFEQQQQLKGVQCIKAAARAFAAILVDGSVVSWGHPRCGGDSHQVQDRLQNICQIQATRQAFAAISNDGHVVTWGDPEEGGDSSTVQEQLQGVKHIQASLHAFAAICEDGSVVTWGQPDDGGDSSAVQEQLRNVLCIQASYCAFAAVLKDGSVVTWGDSSYGGDSSDVQARLHGVHQVQASDRAFAALLSDGSVVCWGDLDYGGDSRFVAEQLTKVRCIQASSSAFAAIRKDGSVVTWGLPEGGGDSRAVEKELSGLSGSSRQVRDVQSSGSAFAAILENGSVVAWGDPEYGGDCSAVAEQLHNVLEVQACDRAFAAILEDGRVISWGCPRFGGNSSAVQEQLQDVQHIAASEHGFAAAFEARQLSNLAWAFATMASREGATVVEALGRAALPRLEGFSSQGLSNMAWALGCTTVFTTGIGERLLRGLAAASVSHGFSPQGLALLAWAFAPDSRMRMDPIPSSPATAKLHLLETIHQEVQVGLRRGSHPRTASHG
eukprot:s3396_g5.t6